MCRWVVAGDSAGCRFDVGADARLHEPGGF